ncbi:type I-B CRISPR-associated protein Cas8b1/Cst1 [Desulfosporosinus nitroreducens]|uniref:type I-B CRISPR-associated protein Cas8b1/Cst1 n=1 Tax=Desulfosporosinus nitroreducens TaxID=2018668 RepID=UPI00207D4D36|nr:type I-B CRISPR-associated protein Cas8b1/Cst1 [Desulfosporosinus nitroreducens]MCO1601602.1 type I-B CRISPR-associated protein Cas8b1/Cst1 [Desulfosporosinus nitroreducens]
MSSDTIRLTMGDWQWNAALIGFINIVGEENVHIMDDTVEFTSDVLDGFEDKYFAYLIHAYEKTLSWSKIVSFKNKLDGYKESNFENFNLKALQSLNTYIKDVKRYTKSNSYKAAYELIDSNVDMLSLEKHLTTIKEPKGQQQFDVDRNRLIAEVKQVVAILRQIIDYCDSVESKRYIGAKNVIYTVIKNAWSGVSFLNAQTKEKDVYIDYKTYFVDTGTDYLKSNKSKYKFNCFVCDAPIKDMSNDLSFLNATGFDVARKSSHVWDFQNDIAICPICKLIYSCLPAGMTYIYDRGIYVNANIRLQDALNINLKIKKDILSSQEGGMRSVYHALVGALHEKENNSAKYELADVQVVRYENESYRFNILSQKMLEIIVAFEQELNSLIKTAFSENGVSVQIHDEVVTRIFNSQNLFTLIHRMLHYKLSDSSKCYFNGAHVTHLLKINQRIYISLGGIKMDKAGEQVQENIDLVKNAKAAGYYLRGEYTNKGSGNKLPGICYRLLNALKTSNTDMFMDVTLNCYLYVRSQVPKVITDVLGKDKSFSTMGYAFVAGMIDAQDSQESSTKKVKGEGK